MQTVFPVRLIFTPMSSGVATVHYYISDNLESTSLVVNGNGTVEEEEMYFPYGGERWTNGTDSNHYKFTGKERDSETGLDYFGARYYGSNMGRWMSPDWADKPTAVPYAQFGDPQSLNLYGYMTNDPLGGVDTDGHCGGPPPEQPCPAPPPQQPTQKPSVGDKIKNAWLTAMSPADTAATWANDHPGIMFPIAIAAAVQGDEGPIEEDGAAIADAGQKLAEGADEVLTRFGTKAESTLEKLSTDATAAEQSPKVGNLHGVSAMANAVKEGGTALRSEIEKVFPVVNTGRNPDHRTMVLPKPVTDAVVDAFNKLFWP